MDAATARALAADLRAAEYTESALAARWGEAADAAVRRADAVAARRALAAGASDPLRTCAELFLFGGSVTVAALEAAVPRAGIEGLVRLGLVSVSGHTVRAEAVVRPVSLGPDRVAGWVASDPDELAGRFPLQEDHVLGVGGASRTLASLLPPAGSGLALDLGCGCGVIALELGLRGFEVIATDISPRALAYTDLNAALNGVEGVRTRLGSLYEPVAGERFSLIASNPPFVITPRRGDVARYEYRDGGFEGDGLMAAVVAGLGAHLTSDGEARLLGNWEDRAGEEGTERLRGWAGDLSLWAIERESLDPVAYAALWIRDGGTRPGTPDYEHLLRAWLDDFADRGVEAIGMGWVVAAGEPGLDRIERLPQPVDAPGVGAHLSRACEVDRILRTLDDDALAASVLLVAPDVTEARHHLPGAEGPTVIELHQGGGLRRTLEVDPALAALVGACDGDLPAGVLIAAIADLLEVDAAPLREELLPRVRELLFTGFLAFA